VSGGVGTGWAGPGGRTCAGQPPSALDAALHEVTREYNSALLSYLIKLLRGDRHKAEDIVQETLIRAWRHPQDRGPNGAWSRQWMFTVARRIAIDYIRAAQARPGEVSDERLHGRGDGEDDIDRMIDINEVREAVRSLPDRPRQVLIEVYFRESTVAEAAEALRVPPDTVKSRTFHAVLALREALLKRGFVPRTSGEVTR
jgi:RNA polymerase sigma-70 factor (ECF subfamily)